MIGVNEDYSETGCNGNWKGPGRQDRILNPLARQYPRSAPSGLRITLVPRLLTRPTHCPQTAYAQLLCLSPRLFVPNHFKYSKHKEIRHGTME